MRIRVTTRADLFEERKRQHIERGCRIEDERPIPVNSLCSFVAVRETPGSDTFSELVALALNGNRARVLIIEVFECRSKFDFVSTADAAYTLGITPDAMDGYNMEVAKVVNLCTSFIFTSGSQREGRRREEHCRSNSRQFRRTTRSRRDRVALSIGGGGINMENNAGGKNEALSPQEESAKAAILAECDKLAKAGVTFVAAHFDGYGDDGATEEVKCFDCEWFAYGEHEPVGYDASRLQEHFEALVPLGYENDCGGFGDVVLDVTACKLTVERNDRFEDYTTTTYEV